MLNKKFYNLGARAIAVCTYEVETTVWSKFRHPTPVSDYTCSGLIMIKVGISLQFKDIFCQFSIKTVRYSWYSLEVPL